MKPHVLNSEIPLTAGQDQVALCGETVERAQWVWWTPESTVWDIGKLPLGCCRKCLMVDIDKTYVYVGVAGKKQQEEPE